MRTYGDVMKQQITQAAQEQAAEDTKKAKDKQKAEHKDPLRAARWAALLAGGIADAESTRRALNRPGVREANPVMKKIAGNDAALYGVKLGVNSGIAALLDKAHQKNPKASNVAALLLSGLQAGIALHNSKQGKKK